MRHGRAVIPFGMYKGVRVANVPSDYLSWLIGNEFMRDDKWHWLLESIAKEFRARGLIFDEMVPQGMRERLYDLSMPTLFDQKEAEQFPERKVRKEDE